MLQPEDSCQTRLKALLMNPWSLVMAAMVVTMEDKYCASDYIKRPFSDARHWGPCNPSNHNLHIYRVRYHFLRGCVTIGGSIMHCIIDWDAISRTWIEGVRRGADVCRLSFIIIYEFIIFCKNKLLHTLSWNSVCAHSFYFGVICHVHNEGKNHFKKSIVYISSSFLQSMHCSLYIFVWCRIWHINNECLAFKY